MPKQLLIRDATSEDLKLIRDEDGTDTALELSKDKLKINGDLECSGVSIDEKTTLNSSELDVPNDFTIDSAGDITLDSATGTFPLNNNGTEFIPDMYAGMILGYTRIANNNTGSANMTITINASSMTVLQTVGGTDLSIQFIVPPSRNVEIQCSFWMAASSDGAKFSLSTGTSYAELGETHTYDADQTVYIDETDHTMHTIKFTVTGLIAGTDATYYLAGLASGANTLIQHGRNRTTGTHFPPIIIKAIALPATITTGE